MVEKECEQCELPSELQSARPIVYKNATFKNAEDEPLPSSKRARMKGSTSPNTFPFEPIVYQTFVFGVQGPCFLSHETSEMLQDTTESASGHFETLNPEP